MAVPEKAFPPAAAEGLKVLGLTLVLADVRPLRKSGWRGFTFLLEGGGKVRGSAPVIRGIYSAGGKDGVRAWMDIEYREEIPFGEGECAGNLVSLRRGGADRALFRALGESIPPGGHMMVSYEGDQPVHEETLLGLSAGVPPAATPLGFLLFDSGFPLVKDWYLAEGGMEGPRKLWGEKPPDAVWERVFRERTLGQILPFLSRDTGGGSRGILEPARARAQDISRMIGAP